MKQRVIILRGAPASGKTTLAKSLSNFNQKIIWIKVDNFKDFFGNSDDALPFVNGSAVATMKYLFNQGFSVVIDGIFQDTAAISEAKSFASQNGIPFKVFELETSLETLKQRDLTREGVPEGLRKPLGVQTIENIYQKLQANPYPNAIKLDTEKNDLEKCKSIINSYFDSTI